MSERARARVIAGSMSAISGALVLALLLGISFLAARLIQPFAVGGGEATVRIGTSAAHGFLPAIAQAPRRARHGGSTTANPRHRTGTPHHSTRVLRDGTSPPTTQTGSPGTSVGVGAGAGPAGASASVTTDGAGARVHAKVKAGPAQANATADPKKIVDHTTDTAKNLICKLAC